MIFVRSHSLSLKQCLTGTFTGNGGNNKSGAGPGTGAEVFICFVLPVATRRIETSPLSNLICAFWM